MTNLSNLRKAVRKNGNGDEDAAGVEWAAHLARVLDQTRPKTLRQIADGEKPLSLEAQLQVIKIAGPQYLRTLHALGLTKSGRAVVAIPTAGSPAGVSHDTNEHERHRQLFRDRTGG